VATQLLVHQLVAAGRSRHQLNQRVQLFQQAGHRCQLICTQVQRGAAQQLQAALKVGERHALQLLHLPGSCHVVLVGHAVLCKLKVEIGTPAGWLFPATLANGRHAF
jgi:hypothetical protein